MNPFRLDGCTVCLTGATGHLGRAMSAGLAAAGARLVLCGRNLQRLNELERELRKAGAETTVIACDLAMPEERQRFVSELMTRFHALDVLINNAHGGRPGPWSQAEEADFAFAQSLAVNAPHDLIQKLLPLLEAGAVRKGGASVINVSSMYGTVSPDPAIYGDSGLNSPPQYGAAKAAMLQLTRYLAIHLAAKKIRVNALTPGPFPRPPIQDSMPEFCDTLRQKVPMKRLGDADEIIGPVLFLASDASSYVTGATLPVDGGWTAW